MCSEVSPPKLRLKSLLLNNTKEYYILKKPQSVTRAVHMDDKLCRVHSVLPAYSKQYRSSEQ